MDRTQIVPRALPPVVLARDVSQRDLRRAIARGSVERIRPGAYLPASEVDDEQWRKRERRALAQIVAVSRQLPSEHVFSYASAALIHGLWLGKLDGKVHVTQRYKRGGPRSPAVQRHHDTLAEDDVVVVNGLRVTSLQRTLTDCARVLHPCDGLLVADSAMRALLRPHRERPELVTGRLDQLRAELIFRVESGSPRGRRQARVIVANANPFAESAPESILRWIALAHGLPRPMLQVRVVTRMGEYYVDLGWEVEVREPGGRIVRWLVLIEYDGMIKYVPLRAGAGLVLNGGDDDGRTASDVVVAEKKREDLIRERPNTLMRRFDWADLQDAPQAFARICSAFPPGTLPELHPVPELLGHLR